ncbi:MAG TPA: hypothetical protein VKT75_12685 [Acidobacteriaceae bacterium]|nr:hypothetical protein [Acidobacteriaceae bacterium]
MAVTAAAGAQTRKVHEYRLHEQEERGAPFGMTLGPDHTLYTLIPRRDGNWILSEVKNWWQDKPTEQGIPVEGFSTREPVASLGQMDLAITPDGQYLVTMISADLRVAADDPYPTDLIVEFVHLADFTVEDTEHMRGLGMRGRLHGGLDRAGHLLVRSEIAPQGGDNGAPFVTWFAVGVPEMKAQLVCSYESGDASGMESSCGDFAKKEGYASAAELMAALWPVPPPSAPPLPDGVSLPPKDRWHAASATVDGKPLSLVVVNGVQLSVYAQP